MVKMKIVFFFLATNTNGPAKKGLSIALVVQVMSKGNENSDRSVGTSRASRFLIKTYRSAGRSPEVLGRPDLQDHVKRKALYMSL